MLAQKGPGSLTISHLMATDPVFERLATRLADQVGEITATAVAAARSQGPAWLVDRPDLGDLLPAGTHASIAAELAAFKAQKLPERLPDVDAEGARLSARTGVPLSRHLALYRIGHAAQWEVWLDLVEDDAPDPAARRALLRRGSRFLFAYADWISGLAGAEYQHERDQLLRSHEQRRVHLVRELLDGRNDIDPEMLDYPLDAHHLGLVISGPDAPTAARALATRFDRRLLLVELVQDTWWAWLGGRRPLTTAELQRIDIPAGVRVAVGDDAPGLDGFRRTHDEAVDAHRVSPHRQIALYDDVVLDVLIDHAADHAKRLAQRELRGIDGNDNRSATLRATLTAYFAHNQNTAATAAALGKHESTIAKRLRTIEHRTGRPITRRRAELELALRTRTH